MKNYLLCLVAAGLLACSPEKNTKETSVPEKRPLKSFQYIAPAPENGTLKGVIELGGDGFNAFIVEVDVAKNWSLKDSEFGVSGVYDNNATEPKIKEGLKAYITSMRAKGVAPANIHFIQSSTASKNDRVITIDKVLGEIGYKINSVTDSLEAAFGYKATMPSDFSAEAFFVDMGSGNTKVAWSEDGRVKSFSTYGSKYYLDSADHAQVYREIEELMSRIPAENLKKCFIIGGGPYQLANKSEDFNERYAVLNPPEAYMADSQKLECALNIYKAIYDSTEKTDVIFDWDSNFSIGFLINL